ncbi:MAG: hypothetical protein ABGY72_18480 [bacterium]
MAEQPPEDGDRARTPVEKRQIAAEASLDVRTYRTLLSPEPIDAREPTCLGMTHYEVRYP